MTNLHLGSEPGAPGAPLISKCPTGNLRHNVGFPLREWPGHRTLVGRVTHVGCLGDQGDRAARQEVDWPPEEPVGRREDW